mmetsp:Transcript_15028/g.12363  ORF Transcript_15028/g.12363 Transcript_15028/m.12363 type:complete len:202 (-) Transcript_15028:1026-1631(-)
MEACQGHELPREAELAEILAEGVHLSVSHARGIPVEGRRKVVGQVGFFARAVDALHTVGEAARVVEDGLGGLSPHDVGIGREVAHAVHASLDARIQHKVALASARSLPAPEDVLAKQFLGEHAGVLVGDAREFGTGLGPLGDLVLASLGRLELSEHGLVIRYEGIGLLPGVHLLRAVGVAVRLGRGVGGAHDENVVAGVLV